MKKLLFIFLMTASLSSAQAQMSVFSADQGRATTIDTARYKLTYALDYTCHPGVESRYDDVRTVLIGRDKIKEFSDVIFHYDSLHTADRKHGADAFRNPNGSPWPYEIVISPKEGRADMKYRLPMGLDILHYETGLPELEWKFVSDTTINMKGYE